MARYHYRALNTPQQMPLLGLNSKYICRSFQELTSPSGNNKFQLIYMTEMAPDTLTKEQCLM
jgi:hypothetical protein